MHADLNPHYTDISINLGHYSVSQREMHCGLCTIKVMGQLGCGWRREEKIF